MLNICNRYGIESADVCAYHGEKAEVDFAVLHLAFWTSLFQGSLGMGVETSNSRKGYDLLYEI